MRNKYVFILVILLLITSLIVLLQFYEMKIIQNENRLENLNPDLCSNRSFSHMANFQNSRNQLEQTNENSIIYLNTGLNINTYVNITTIFKAQAYHPGSAIIEYYWDFDNDGVFELSTLELGFDEPSEVNYTYNETGNYTVKVEARDSWDTNSTSVDFINVWVKNGTGNQEYVNVIVNETQIGPPAQPLPPDGNIEKYAVIINGDAAEWYWEDVEFTYDMLINEYEYSPDNIYLMNHNGLNPDGENPNGMIDYPATHYNIHKVLNDLTGEVEGNEIGEVDGDDILTIWVTDHGNGMLGPHHKYYGYFSYNINLNVDEPGDEHDYLESDFKLRSFWVSDMYCKNLGMGEWGCWRKQREGYDDIYARIKFVSHFTDVYFGKLNETVSDTDKFIEMFTDYLEGDFDQDGWLELDQGEVEDYDNDSIPPYDPETGLFDEDDWGEIYSYEDDWRLLCGSGAPGGWDFMIWDEDLDNHVDIDLDTTFDDDGILVVDGTDIDNEGLFDGLDINSDGDKDDWVSIDESIMVFESDPGDPEFIQDDELELWLKNIEAGRIITVLQPCFSGGFIWDLKGPKRITCSADVDDDYSQGNEFIRGVTAALYWEDFYGDPVDADTNDDGNVSIAEAFNYAVKNLYLYPKWDNPQYGDNGDGISHGYPIPNGTDGYLGEKTYLFTFEKSENTPNKPCTPSGEINGQINVEYTYNSSTTDPDGDQVFYFWDWGDGTFSNWLGPYNSSDICEASHTWSKKGTYSIKVKAMDLFGDESDWSDTLPVIIPVNLFFGYTTSGVNSQNIKNRISGSKFTVLANGTADCIIVYIQTSLGTPPDSKCMIYSASDSTLIGTTEEKTLNTGEYGAWVMYNFSDPKPSLTTNSQYVLVCWSNDTCNISYNNASNVSYGRYKSHIYGTAPTPSINWNDNESRFYSIYCGYSTVPEIKSVSASPDPIGFGYNTTIAVNVEHYGAFIDTINVSIAYPNSTAENFSMTQVDNDTFQYVFNDAWMVGQYNYSIWVLDEFGANCSSTNHSFNVSAMTTISVCTIKDEYCDNETVNLTDPPDDPSLIGYELLGDGDVLHIWNKCNSYYFDTNSGIQLTNHYDEYWSHNVLMLGYYNNDVWNLIYRTDELSGFNKDIDTDNETFVNATLWKDLNYGGYDFRLAIRYHLGVDGSDLTVIPYIKNLGQAIPYVLGFGWEMKDIQIANVNSDNYLRIFNGTGWEDVLLGQTLDKVFTNMDHNTTVRLICTNPPTYHLSRDLYLSWAENLTYKVICKSRTGQYNAPVTLFIKIGTLNVGQEKYTRMHWLDSDEWLGISSSEHDSCCGSCSGAGLTLENALDGTMFWEHYATETHWFILDLGQTYTVKKVRGRSLAYADPTSVNVYVSDSKTSWGTAVATGINTWKDTVLWQEVDTTDKNGRYVKVEIDVTEDTKFNYIEFGGCEAPFTIFDVYGDIPDETPVISDPFPADDSTGVSISPLLNITVSDPNGDSMNITWLSNSSGSWQVFGVNSSVGNGTYHQTMVNASVNGEWWYWKVNVSDGTNYAVSDVFQFFTGYESKIVNTGSTSIKGFLLIQVQYYNETSESWVVADDTVNETSPRIINWDDPESVGEPNILALDTIFNGLVNTSMLTYFGNGTYRIYAAFRDPNFNVLKCDDDTELFATRQFTITYS